MAEQEQFKQLLLGFLSTENEIRTQAEVYKMFSVLTMSDSQMDKAMHELG